MVQHTFLVTTAKKYFCSFLLCCKPPQLYSNSSPTIKLNLIGISHHSVTTQVLFKLYNSPDDEAPMLNMTDCTSKSKETDGFDRAFLIILLSQKPIDYTSVKDGLPYDKASDYEAVKRPLFFQGE